MFNLIVPVIAVVVAAVLLIIFLAKVAPRFDERKKDKSKKVSNERKSFSSNLSSKEDLENNLSNSEVLESKNSNDFNNFTENNEVITEDLEIKQKNSISDKFKNFFSNFNFSDKNNNLGQKNQFSKQSRLSGLKNQISNRISSVKNSVTSPKNDTENSNKGQVSRMSEILINNKNNSNNFSVAINVESELVKQISLDPKNPESYRRLGDFYVRNDRLQDARECYKYVLRLDPRHKRAQLAMARLDRILA